MAAETSPYQSLPARQYWKTGVSQASVSTVDGIYTKRFPIDGLKIATAGSCFAQHISVHLRQAGYAVLDQEPAPGHCRPETAQRFGYRLYSARHGNIYCPRQLLQLTQEACGLVTPDPGTYVWTKNGRYFDALRPSVEPDGLPSVEEVLAQRADHLRRFRSVLNEADLFIFTLGLTETWQHGPSGLVYPTAPGTIAGTYDPAIHEFRNFGFKEIYDDFVAFRALAQAQKPGMRFLVTVSPVPLTATAEDRHVLVSTVHSKAVLRAVAGQLYDDFHDIDYFPSFELVSTPFLNTTMFDENRRTVRGDAVTAVMQHFLKEHPPVKKPPVKKRPRATARKTADVQCEEAMLEAFAR